jgi:two-component system chemotaxis response regulator CheY
MSFNVLIVDDSPVMRSFIRRILDLSGIELKECFEANDGQEALDVLRISPADVILTDINMPRMNGEQLVRCLGTDEVLSRIPVIVVSTDRTESRAREMLALGAKGYVTKPFLPEALREEIENVLEFGHGRN